MNHAGIANVMGGFGDIRFDAVPAAPEANVAAGSHREVKVRTLIRSIMSTYCILMSARGKQY